MTDERVCARCGKGSLPARCRVHDECLSSGRTTATSAPRAPQLEAQLWFDDEASRWKWSERVWMEAECGESVYTTESRGFAHECGQDGCRLTQVATEQPDFCERIDWEVVDMHTVLPEPPSTFEAGFPEVFFRARGKSDDDTDLDEKPRVDAHRWLEMERLDTWLTMASKADGDQALRAASDCAPADRATVALTVLRQLVLL